MKKTATNSQYFDEYTGKNNRGARIESAPAQTEGERVMRINTAPAQTWNYLNVNDVAFELPQNPRFASASELFGPQLSGTENTNTELSNSELQAEVTSGTKSSPKQNTAQDTLTRGASLETNLGKNAVAWFDQEGSEVCSLALHDGDQLSVRLGKMSANIVCEVEKNAHARLSLWAHTDEACEPYGSLLRIIVHEGAELTLTGLYTNAQTPYFEGLGIELEDNARLIVKHYVLSSHKTALGATINQAGKHASVELTSRYLVGTNELLDMTYTSRMRGTDTLCSMNFSGVLDEGAQKNLRETIDLIHGAKRAEGTENETVLLTGDNIINRSLPTILCDEDDVAGNHGATIGSISAEQLSYLRSRGLTDDDISSLFKQAVLDEARANIDEVWRQDFLRACKNLFEDNAMNGILED